MHRKGNTDSSFELPDFFHLNKVNLITHRSTESHKQLRPDLKSKCSPDSTILSPHNPTKSDISPHSSFDNTLKNKPSRTDGLLETVRSQIDIKAGIKPSFHYKSPYYSLYSQILSTSGFNKNKSSFSGDFENLNLVRKESGKVRFLQQKIQNITKSKPRMNSDFNRLLKEDERRLIKIKSTRRLKMLDEDISKLDENLKIYSSSSETLVVKELIALIKCRALLQSGDKAGALLAIKEFLKVSKILFHKVFFW